MPRFLVSILVDAPSLAAAASRFLWDDSGESATEDYLDFQVEAKD